jgi:GDP-L-fucose synthase
MIYSTLCLFGGSGFLGKNLEADFKPSRTDCDLLDAISIRNFLSKNKPNSVINCAAEHDSFAQMSTDHTRYLENNILMSINLLRECHRLDIENVLLMGSISGFPEKSEGEVTEKDFYNGEVNTSNFGYNMSKRILPSLVKAYQLDHGRHYKVVHLGNVYGPEMEFSNTATLVGNLIYKVWEAKKSGSVIKLFGSGKDVRSLTFVKDVEFLIKRMLPNDKVLEPIIISSGFEISVANLVHTIAHKMNFEGDVIFTGKEEKGSRKVARSELLAKYFPDFQFTSILDGLDATIDYFLSTKF